MDKVLEDRRSLWYLQENFGEVYHEGWVYRTVKPYWSDNRSVCMEFVPGFALSAVPKLKMNEAEYHCGVWLVLYHNKILNGRPSGLIYCDLNAHNIIIDFAQKRATAIDPGSTWGRSGYIYEDIVKHIFSVLMSLVAKRKARFSSTTSFLRGYAPLIKVKFKFFIYCRSLVRALRRQFRYYAKRKRSFTKFTLFFLAVCCLTPFFLLFVPAYLFLRGERTSQAGKALQTVESGIQTEINPD